MPYPVVTNSLARRWWKDWQESGDAENPPQVPDRQQSGEGGEHEWPSIVAGLMDDLGTLYDRVDGGKAGTAEEGPIGRIMKRVSGRRPRPKKADLTADRFEAEACIRVHKALPRDCALADPEFWIWMAVCPGQELVRRRYPRGIPGRDNFTSPNAQETLFYRLWIRAELAHNPDDLCDPYELARCGDVDFWRSHVFRQQSMEATELRTAFIRFQHPEGPEGKKQLSQKEVRELVKHVRRAAANVLVGALDQKDATRFVEEQWEKVQST